MSLVPLERAGDSSSAHQSGNRYVPPHLRNRPQSSQQTQPQQQPQLAQLSLSPQQPSHQSNVQYAPAAVNPSPSTSGLKPLANTSAAPSSASYTPRQIDSQSAPSHNRPHSQSYADRPSSVTSAPSYGGRDIRGGNYAADSANAAGSGATRTSNMDVRTMNGDGFSRGGGRGGGSGFSSRRAAPSLKRDPILEKQLFGDPSERTKGIDFKNYEDIPVEASGLDVPAPIESFADLTCHDVLKSNIELAGYEKPTPVQKNSIPISIAGRDLMACAQTGSGKTAAFLFPLIASILDNGLHLRPPPTAQSFRQRKGAPSALVLAPTRELATQIYNEARKFTYRTGLCPVVVYGGQDFRSQAMEIDRGCDILVATPGRLVDFLERGRLTLSMVEFLVFDEADRMLDMGFEPQIRQIVQSSDMTSPSRQTLMFSATFPKEIQRLAQDFLKNYVFLAVGRVGSTTDFITQRVEYAGARSDDEKIDRLMQILSTCEGLTLIFVETKRGADALEYALIKEGIQATSIHGDRSQQDRENALAMFRCGRCPVLVATDVASRGLDIPDVRCVVNFDLPSNIDDYVHRIGRTGRAGNKGTAISFVSEKNRPIIRDLYELLKENNQEIPTWLDQMNDTGHGFGGSSGRFGGGRGGGGRGRGGNRGGFASRDYRSEMQGTARYSSANNSHAHESDGHSSHRAGGGGHSQSQNRSSNRGSYNDSW